MSNFVLIILKFIFILPAVVMPEGSMPGHQFPFSFKVSTSLLITIDNSAPFVTSNVVEHWIRYLSYASKIRPWLQFQSSEGLSWNKFSIPLPVIVRGQIVEAVYLWI
jgi:hypothetical protein